MGEAALRERRREDRREERRGERYQGGRKISSLLKRDWAGDAEKKQQQQLFLCYPPEKSVGNMLQRKNILLTAP